jgi:hypothetical protein
MKEKCKYLKSYVGNIVARKDFCSTFVYIYIYILHVN